jgi:hypothetical protein
MGGHALKTTNQERLERKDYLIIEKEVIKKIEIILDCYYIPRYFDDKETFGDLDILYDSDDDEIYLKIVALLESKECVKNDNIFSCEYKLFQVDFIKTDPVHIECNKCFLDYGSFGEITSKMFKKYELKYGHNGLYMKVYHNHDRCKLITKICLTTNPKEVFDYIGLEYEKFKNGFNTQEEMFDFIVKCNYFDKNIYVTDDPNYLQKTKEKKRPVYKNFVDYITDKEYPVNNYIKYCDENKTEYQINTIRLFDKEDVFNEENIKYQNQIKIKSIYNGKLVNNLTKYENKELGTFMKNFKEKIENFDEYILTTEEDKISDDITEYFIQDKINKIKNNQM